MNTASGLFGAQERRISVRPASGNFEQVCYQPVRTSFDGCQSPRPTTTNTTNNQQQQKERETWDWSSSTKSVFFHACEGTRHADSVLFLPFFPHNLTLDLWDWLALLESGKDIFTWSSTMVHSLSNLCLAMGSLRGTQIQVGTFGWDVYAVVARGS